ncbi:MAG: hypothetical protein U0838_14670 [Chloroflexota bacterium]
MHRRLILVGILAMALAACGGSSGSASPSASDTGSASPSAEASSSAGPISSASPSEEASASLPASGSTATAICDGISLRKKASSSGTKVKTIGSGTEVHVAATVTGTAYSAGSCGTSGNTWLKIDKVGGKSVKTTYGVSYVYAAAGFFE